MYQITKSVILSRRFELSDMLRKIDAIWLQGGVTDEEKTELEDLAREQADPAMSIDVLRRLEHLELRVKALEGGADPGKYPVYVEGQPTRHGERYLWKGKLYEVVLPANVTTCVWSPDAYPAYWTPVQA